MSERSAATVASQTPATADTAIMQRSCACGTHTHGSGTCPDCAKRPQARRSALPGAPGATMPLDGAYGVLRSPGQPLDTTMRGVMEPRFARDLSSVRIHHDDTAARAAASIGAAAYTIGSDIAFAAGRYRPHSPAGLHLLAHELAHVVQHRAFGTPYASTDTDAISDPSDAAEREAETAAERVMRGGSAQIASAPQASLHRLSEGETAGVVVGSVAGAALLGVGIAWLAGAFDREVFSDTELRTYLDGLATRRRIEGNRDSDNKARDLVRRWSEGDRTFNLDAGHRTAAAALSNIELKRLLIQEMLDGAVLGGDENAILLLLERASAEQLVELLDPNGGVSIQALDNAIGGDNHARFERLLETRFPAGSPQRDQAAGECSARQALMLNYARQRATQMVENAVRLLTQTPRSEAVARALACRFSGADAAQIDQIRAVFERVATLLPQRLYRCGAERGAAALEGVTIRLQDGRTHTAQCISEYAEAAGLRSSDGSVEFGREVALCPQFFAQGPSGQAITVVHESLHAAGLLTDPRYQPDCGLSLATALQNPDSFAYFADDLMSGTSSAAPAAPAAAPAGGGMPRVEIGHFRTSGAISAENRCEVCAELPGLGLDSNTFLNIMELRGDITDHRGDVEYDFKRSKDRTIWRLDGSGWHLLHRQQAGTADDRSQRDEFLTPVNNHIYAVDGPGLQDVFDPIPDAATAQEAIYMGSFTESVEARSGSGAWSRVSNEFPWHSVTWIENVGGQWRRKPGENRIAAGAITIGDTPPQAAPATTSPPGAATGTAPVPASPEPAPDTPE